MRTEKSIMNKHMLYRSDSNTSNSGGRNLSTPQATASKQFGKTIEKAMLSALEIDDQISYPRGLPCTPNQKRRYTELTPFTNVKEFGRSITPMNKFSIKLQEIREKNDDS